MADDKSIYSEDDRGLVERFVDDHFIALVILATAVGFVGLASLLLAPAS